MKTKSKTKKKSKTDNKTDNRVQEKSNINEDTDKDNRNNSGFLKGCLIGSAIILVSFLVLALTGALIYFLAIKDEKRDAVKDKKQDVDMRETVNSPLVREQEMIEYSDEEFGIKIKLPLSWKGYDVKKELMGGDFQIGSLQFFYPVANLDSASTRTDNISDGFVRVFDINVFLKETFDDPARDKAHDGLQYGEVLGRNNHYVFTLSHLNGDVTGYPRLGKDLQKIKDKIKISSTSGQISPIEDPDFLVDSSDSGTQTADSITGAELNAYKGASIVYPNCKYQYRIFYPPEWSNNSMTKKSDQVSLYGNNITVNINAFHNSNNLTLEQFKDQRSNLISADLVDSLKKFRAGARIIGLSYQNPRTLLIVWQNGNYNLELKVIGSGIAKDERAIGKFLAAINFYDPDIIYCDNTANNNYSGENYNVYNENYDTDIDNYDAAGDVPYCDYENDPDCWPQGDLGGEFDCNGWQHPNGDIEYWWDSITDYERECYIHKYGQPDL